MHFLSTQKYKIYVCVCGFNIFIFMKHSMKKIKCLSDSNFLICISLLGLVHEVCH